MLFGNHRLVQLIDSNVTLLHLAVLKGGLFLIRLCTELDNMAIIVAQL